MELTTNTVSIDASKQHKGQAIIDIPAGQTLKIELSPGGTEVLSFERPAEATACQAHIYIAINEVD